jgi:hypothetical protein
MKARTIKIIVFVVFLLVVVGLVIWQYSLKENYDNVFYNKDLNPNILTRPTFNSNLDPRNPEMYFDPNAYGGFIKGSSPNSGELGSDNTISSQSIGTPSQKVQMTSSQQVLRGKFDAGINDAGQFVKYSDYTPIQTDFASMASQNKNTKIDNYKKSLRNKSPDTLQYTVPSDLLPVPDMRQSPTRDPSDPSNFMYDRTVFAPLKKRNRNEADRIRGDLDIAPIKTGYFDVATVPQVDLVKGYMGYFNDIQEVQDIQDIAYSRSRDEALSDKQGVLKSDNKLTSIMTEIGKEMTSPKLVYATPPPVSLAPKDLDPWYSTITGDSKRTFAT